jgi:hypothetical protein
MNVYTTQIADLQNVQRAIKHKKNVTDDDYLALQFEYGCQFAEWFNGGDKEAALILTTDKEALFWKWWKIKWVIDDRSMLKYNDAISYQEAKKAMIGDENLENQLYLHLSAIKFI